MSDPTDALPADDTELVRIVTEERKVLTRVREAAQTAKVHVTRSYDQELLELRDAIAEARAEDVPPLLAELERVREVANRRAEVPSGVVNASSPYFGHLKLEEGGRLRDVLIGNATYVDTDRAVRIVDWRDAPVSRIYYRYGEGDEYEEEFGGRLTEGVVKLRRAVVIRDGELRRVVAPQGVFYPMKGRWTRGTVHATRLSGGQLTAVRPPTEEERQALSARRTGRLGTGQEGREDRHLPDIPALIDPRQFELLSRPGSGLVVIQGGAGSGKTTIGLHRMAYLAFQDRARYAPETMLVVVFNRALASYIERVLPGLGVAGVPVVTFQAWASKQRRKHVPRAPEGYAEHTPPVVSRMKKHPAMLRLMEERVARRVAEARAALLTTAERAGAGALVGRAWDALEGVALSRRLSALSQWLRGERELSGASRAGLDARGASAVQRAVDQQMKKARDVVWDWAELVTDRAALQGALDREAPGAFLPGEVAQAVAWSAEHLSRWVGVEPTDAESLSGEDREGARREAREAREARREARRSRSEDEREVLEDEAPMKALVRAERADRVRRGEDVEDSDDDDDQGPLLGADGRVEADEPPTLDPEDDALLLRLYQLKRGGLRGAGTQPMAYAHLFVDEAQDLSPVELSVLVGVASEDRSVTLAGDTAQRLLLDNGFSDWAGVLGDLGLSRVEVEPLKIGYRSTLEVLQFAREVLGPLADPEPPLATRSGAPVEFHGFQDPGAAVAFLGQALRDLMTEEPRANVAVVARDPARAALYHDGLLRAEVPRLKLVTDQDFTFRPGVEVTDIRQVKGLEWDYVVLVDVNRTWYPADDEARHLLHIGATRAAHQLWVLSTGTPSALVPEYLQRE